MNQSKASGPDQVEINCSLTEAFLLLSFAKSSLAKSHFSSLQRCYGYCKQGVGPTLDHLLRHMMYLFKVP